MQEFPSEYSQYRVLLEKVKVAAMGRIGPQVLGDLRLETELDNVTRHMVLKMQTFIYQHKVGEQDVTVPYSETTVVRAPTPRRQWLLVLPVAVGMALTAATQSWPVLALSMVLALCLVVWHASNPPVWIGVKLSGEVTVNRKYFNQFPDNTVIYPPEWGSAVQAVVDTVDRKQHWEHG